MPVMDCLHDGVWRWKFNVIITESAVHRLVLTDDMMTFRDKILACFLAKLQNIDVNAYDLIVKTT